MNNTLSAPKNENVLAPEVEQASQEDVYRPDVDIVETPDAVLLTANVPGADEQSVETLLENNILAVRARVEPPKLDGFTLSSAEYGVGNYERSFTLSQAIDRAAIDATVKDGVLRVRLPKVKEAASRKIRVSGG
jgi:HSP20 family molecular chaperone IbpA